MSLNYRQQHQLHRIEAGLRRSDPQLGGMFGMFGRLYPEPDLPAWEQQPRGPAGPGRISRAAAWLVSAFNALPPRSAPGMRPAERARGNRRAA
jgi:hypothetical protein